MKRTKHRLVPWLLAAVFVALQAIALAHEISHDLRQHDDTSCLLHVHSKHTGGAAAAQTLLPPVFAVAERLPAAGTSAPAAVAALGYHTRAPPRAA